MSVGWMAEPGIRVAAIIVGGGVVLVVVRRALRVFRDFLVDRTEEDEDDRRIVTVMRGLKHAVTIVLVLIVLTLTFSELGLSIAPLLGTAGIAGVALGLAAQGLARDILSGLALLMDNQIRLGDEVEIAGKKGTIESLSLRSIRLREWDGSVHFIRTGEVGTVTNRSVGYGFAVLEVEMAEDTDIGAAREAITKAAADVAQDPVLGRDVLDSVDIAGVERWGQDAVVIKVRLKVRPTARAPVRRLLLARVRERLRAAGIEGPTQRVALKRANARGKGTRAGA